MKKNLLIILLTLFSISAALAQTKEINIEVSDKSKVKLYFEPEITNSPIWMVKCPIIKSNIDPDDNTILILSYDESNKSKVTQGQLLLNFKDKTKLKVNVIYVQAKDVDKKYYLNSEKAIDVLIEKQQKSITKINSSSNTTEDGEEEEKIMKKSSTSKIKNIEETEDVDLSSLDESKASSRDKTKEDLEMINELLDDNTMPEKIKKLIISFNGYCQAIANKKMDYPDTKKRVLKDVFNNNKDARIQLASKTAGPLPPMSIDSYLDKLNGLSKRYLAANFQAEQIRIYGKPKLADDGHYYISAVFLQKFEGCTNLKENLKNCYKDATQKVAQFEISIQHTIVNGKEEIKWNVFISNISAIKIEN